MDEWNWDKNNELGLNPEKLTCGSGKRAWWICKNGHEWESTIDQRNNGTDCPYCSGRKAIVGVNDLETVNPKLAKEWHPTKNGKLTPKDVKCGSRNKVWWQCNKGHEWEAKISSRNSGTGCPYCYKEKQTSFAEQAIFFYCNKITNAINRYTELGKEIDIYLPEYNIGIEYNGSYWHKNKENEDNNKVRYFANKDIRIITVKEGYENLVNGDIIEHNHRDKNTINFVIKTIFDLIGIEYEDVDIDRDLSRINEQYINIEKENSIAVKHPKSIKEWNYEKNGSILPTMIASGSGKKVWWKCEKCGHEWRSVVSSYSKGHGCPECGKKIISKKNEKQIRCVETGIIYDSIQDAEVQTCISAANISSVCRGKSNTAGGYHWEFVDENSRMSAEKIKKDREIKKINNIINLQRKVYCVENGISYDSIVSAGKETGISAKCISAACNGKTKTAGGYHFEFVDAISNNITDETRRKISEANKDRNCKRVRCIETGIIYHSMKNAIEETGARHISSVCNGKRKTAGGYHWEFVEGQA